MHKLNFTHKVLKIVKFVAIFNFGRIRLEAISITITIIIIKIVIIFIIKAIIIPLLQFHFFLSTNRIIW